MNEIQLNAREKRRFTLEAKADEVLQRREQVAQKMIGQLVRDGKVVYYAWPVGGKYVEDKDEIDLLYKILKMRLA
jgi:hypothetical protein